MTLVLPKGSLITVGGVQLSEHSRKEATIDFQPIQVSGRTLVGTLKRQTIAAKRTLSTSWEHLPAHDSATLDGKAGRNTIKGLVDANWTTTLAPLTLLFYEVNNSGVQSQVTMYVFIETYNEVLVKRLTYQHWNLSISFIEV